jgi:hypothetical protein
MFRRTLSLATALFGALATSQLPEFTQQYSQRLGGAIDELTRVVQRFDRDWGAIHAEDRKAALARLTSSHDELVRRQGVAMEANIARLDALQAQQARMAVAGPLGRIEVFLSNPDPEVAAATLDAFQPAIPATSEGAISGGAGFLLGGGVAALFSRLFRRRPGYAESR